MTISNTSAAVSQIISKIICASVTFLSLASPRSVKQRQRYSRSSSRKMASSFGTRFSSIQLSLGVRPRIESGGVWTSRHPAASYSARWLSGTQTIALGASLCVVIVAARRWDGMQIFTEAFDKTREGDNATFADGCVLEAALGADAGDVL